MVCRCSKSIKFNIFICCHVYEGIPLAPTGMKFCHEILETLNYHMVKTRRSLSHLVLDLYRVVTDEQTDGKTDRITIANTHYSYASSCM